MKNLLFVLGVLFVLSFNLIYAQEDENPKLYEKLHEFDFWIGEWNVYKYGTDTLVGISKIKSILDSMAIRETYKSTRGDYEGTSLNKYNQKIKKWEQFWVSNDGMTLHLTGGLNGNNMILSDRDTKKTGDSINKIIWIPQKDGTVHQIWKTSKDDGISWKTLFYGEYRRIEF